MDILPTSVDPTVSRTRRRLLLNRCKAAAYGATFGLAMGLATLPVPARAVDGCLVLLCFAAPAWSAIAQCVPPIQQVLRDLARGRPFPSCSMSGGGNSASHHWSTAPVYCPTQYTRAGGVDGSGPPVCDYVGAVEVVIDGNLWTRTWWRWGGDTVTEYTPAAKAQLGTWDTRFDDDYAAWLASQPSATPCDICT